MDSKYYMQVAIAEARKSLKYGDVPVGAVIVYNGKIISKAHNQKEKKNMATAHAEILSINKANKKLKNFRLSDCEIYVTKEPCLMCMGALLSCRIKKITFGAYDPRFGTKELAENNKFNHKCEIEGGVMEDECKNLLSQFFKSIR